MGSAVLSCCCQMQWTSNIAASGHIASFSSKASSLLRNERVGRCNPAGDSRTCSVISIWMCQQWYVLPIVKFTSVYIETLWLLPGWTDLYSLWVYMHFQQNTGWIVKGMELNCGSCLIWHFLGICSYYLISNKFKKENRITVLLIGFLTVFLVSLDISTKHRPLMFQSLKKTAGCCCFLKY